MLSLVRVSSYAKLVLYLLCAHMQLVESLRSFYVGSSFLLKKKNKTSWMFRFPTHYIMYSTDPLALSYLHHI